MDSRNMTTNTGMQTQDALAFQHNSRVGQPQMRWAGAQAQMPGAETQEGQMQHRMGTTPQHPSYDVNCHEAKYKQAQQMVPSACHQQQMPGNWGDQQQQNSGYQQWPQQQYLAWYPGAQMVHPEGMNAQAAQQQPVYYIAGNQYFQQIPNQAAYAMQYAHQQQMAQGGQAGTAAMTAAQQHYQNQGNQMLVYPYGQQPVTRSNSAPNLNVGVTGTPTRLPNAQAVGPSQSFDSLRKNRSSNLGSPVGLKMGSGPFPASSDQGDIPTDAGVDEGRSSVMSGNTFRQGCRTSSDTSDSGSNANPTSPPAYIRAENPTSPPAFIRVHSQGSQPTPTSWGMVHTPNYTAMANQRAGVTSPGMRQPHTPLMRNHYGRPQMNINFANFQQQHRNRWTHGSPCSPPHGGMMGGMRLPHFEKQNSFVAWGETSPGGGLLTNKKRSKRRRQSREEARRARRAPRFQLPVEDPPMPMLQLKAFHQKNKIDQKLLAEIPRQAKFLIIKSFHEDDVHKAIKFKLWSSTPHGNEKLQKVWEEAQEEAKSLSEDGSGKGPDGRSLCPLYLLFSVNKSKGFCGICEMVGPVDFERKVEWWVRRNDGRNRWRGAVPLRWIVVKDVPNTVFRDLCFPGSAHRPVIFSRDTTEVAYAQGCTFVNLFKGHESQTTLLQDMEFYDAEYEEHLRRKAEGSSDKGTVSSPSSGSDSIPAAASFAKAPSPESKKEKPVSTSPPSYAQACSNSITRARTPSSPSPESAIPRKSPSGFGRTKVNVTVEAPPGMAMSSSPPKVVSLLSGRCEPKKEEKQLTSRSL